MKPNQAKAQASEVAYELHTLGWKAFQNLCIAIVADVWGQTVQSFYDSKDGGRDGAFKGQWISKEGEEYLGSFSVQCKFTSNPSKYIKLADLSDELVKAESLAARGLADNYFLFANARMSGVEDEKISKRFGEIKGIKRFVAYGLDRISAFIRESSRLRMMVPRVYGLGDLSQILDERASQQAKEILSFLGEDLNKFVITDAYRKSARALIDEGFVLLLGEPACGKSTIAAALAVGALDEWGCSTFKIRNASEFISHSNPNESKQFFWVDDAFGATQLDLMSAQEWNSVFAHMSAAIRRGARILFTSRDYIYKSARRFLKESALPLIRESQVVIHVEKLSRNEREQILYNHIRLGDQERKFKKRIKPFLPKIALHAHFSPEIARRLGNAIFTKRLFIYEEGIDDFVSRPIDFLCEIIQTIDLNSRAALALVFMRGGALPSPVSMSSGEARALTLLGGSEHGMREALNSISGSLVLLSTQGGSNTWRFKHPTVRDAFAKVVAENHELLDIYLIGAPIEMLLGEVTCGGIRVVGAKVSIPADRYDLIVSRLAELNPHKDKDWKQRDKDQDMLHRFLSYRAGCEFLVKYLDSNPGFLDSLKVWSYLNSVSDMAVISRLNDLGLLPEVQRLKVVEAIRELAVETPDAGFLSDEFCNLTTSEEKTLILGDIRSLLIPNLDAEIEIWRRNFHGDGTPEDYFDSFVSALKDYKRALADEEVATQIDAALLEIERVVDEMQSDLPEEREDDDFATYRTSEDASDSRSIFDDVDQ